MNNNQKIDNDAMKTKIYYALSFVAVLIIAILFTFPLYWTITGAFKTGKEINATSPIWIPSEWVLENFQRLMAKRSAPILGWKIGDLTIGAATIPGALRTFRIQKYLLFIPKLISRRHSS